MLLHNTLVRAVVRRELDDRAIGEAPRKLQDISDCRATGAIQPPILDADGTEVVELRWGRLTPRKTLAHALNSIGS